MNAVETIPAPAMSPDVDVVVYDNSGVAGAFGHKHNASKPTGGTEVHLAQLCEGFGRAGLSAVGFSAVPEVDGVYRPHDDDPISCRALITCGLSKLPANVTTDRHVVLWTHTAAQNIPHIPHLRWSEMVCVSQWQANGFPFGWKTHVIHPIVSDAVYELPPVEKDPDKFVCVSAHWKGGRETLQAWEQLRPSPSARLHIGSPYSHPPDFRDHVERTPGCVWVDLASPQSVVEAMRDAAGVFRVVTAPETFGVVDVIAQVVGTRVHAWCPNGLGGMAEALKPSPWVTTDGNAFATEFHKAYRTPPKWGFEVSGKDFRAERIIPQWVELLELAR